MLAALLELAPAGLDERSQGSLVEYGIYVDPDASPPLQPGAAKVAGVPVEVVAEQVPDDWAERWKRFHHPLLLDGRLYIRPPWEDTALRAGLSEVVIDPGQAFGTGTHATTRICLDLLLGRSPARGGFADLGTGSGVLAIAAAKLGFRPVLGVDADPAALEAARSNAAANAVALELRPHDLRNQPAPVAPTVAANLTAPLLERVAELWRGSATLPQAVIASGLLDADADGVRAAFAELGYATATRAGREGWAGLLLERG